MDLEQLNKLRDILLAKYAECVKAETALTKEGLWIEKRVLDRLTKAKKEWVDADADWRKALIEYAEQLHLEKIRGENPNK